MQEGAENSGPAQHRDGATLTDLSRWLAAGSYVFFVCLFVMYEVRVNRRDEFVRFHARQGFVLFFSQVVFIVVAYILGSSVGAIPWLGAIIMITFKFLGGLLAVGLSVWGFVEALGGERWELPLLAAWARRIPLS